MLRIKAERLRRKLTQQKVAVDCNMSYADISRIETGRMLPYPSHMKRLSDYFNISEQELLMEVKYHDEINATRSV